MILLPTHAGDVKMRGHDCRATKASTARRGNHDKSSVDLTRLLPHRLFFRTPPPEPISRLRDISNTSNSSVGVSTGGEEDTRGTECGMEVMG